MTNKLEQAAQALLAHWDTPAWKYLKPTGDLMADLREALAYPELNLNCKSVQKRLATSWGYVKAEQAEQEPVGFQAREIGEGDWFDVGLDEIARITGIINSPILDYRWIYAAPVRTKDLTDDEIEWLVVDTLETWNSKDTMKDFARAVIAADREKNK